MTRPLDRRSEVILTFIRDHIQKHGWAPTVREICKAVDIDSTSVVQGHLIKLEARGYIKRGEHMPRAIALVS